MNLTQIFEWNNLTDKLKFQAADFLNSWLMQIENQTKS